ncbi:MAG: response regulator [Pseudomonadales bacterium]|nr:response regulator [Pseudomonadales bacterium]
MKNATVLRQLPRGTETILLVEDDDATRMMIGKLLKRLGYRVYEARDSLDALETLAFIDDLHLLLTDVLLPNGANGMSIAELVEAHFPETRILLMSGSVDYILETFTQRLGSRELLKKPMRNMALANHIRMKLDTVSGAAS